MRPVLNVAFTDFWHGSSNEEIKSNPVYDLLSRYYELKLTDKPDFLIYSCFGKKFLNYDCTRIFYTGENVRPNFNQCDYAFSFDYPVTDRNYRLPLYFLYGYFDEIHKRGNSVPDPSQQKFCNFLYSNKRAPERIEFLHKLMTYKHVDSGGKVMNNIGGRVADKMSFLREYKFTIAFENSSYPGYTTEKLVEALIARTIPIYWGNPLVNHDFNPDCFINCHEFEDFDEVIDHVKKIDADDDLYHSYIAAPAFTNKVDNEFINEQNLLARLQQIFTGPTRSQVAGQFDRLKYLLNPARPADYLRLVARRWRNKRHQL